MNSSNPQAKAILEQYPNQFLFQVYLAKNINNQMLVAIKCILISRFKDHNGMVGELIKNEKNALMRLDHPNVVKIYEYIESLN